MAEQPIKRLTKEEHDAIFAVPSRSQRRANNRKRKRQGPARTEPGTKPSARELFAARHYALTYEEDGTVFRVCACRRMAHHAEADTIYA